MADRYWVGGTGSWNTTLTTNWSTTSGGAGGASVPTAADAVIVDAASGSPIIGLISTGLLCSSLTTTGATCTFTGTGTITISGNFTLSATTTWSATGTITINASSTVTTNGVIPAASISLNATGNTLTLGSALTLQVNRTFSLNNGTLNLNNFTLSAGVLSSGTTNVRQIQFGTGNITITNTGSSVTFNGTNFTYTGTPTLNISYTGSFGVTVLLPSFTATNALNVNYTTGTYTLTDTTPIYKNLNFTGFNGTTTSQTRIIYGDFTIPASGGTFSTMGTNTFAATSGTQVITTNGRSIGGGITKSQLGSTVELAGALTIAGTFLLSNGTLNLANFTLTASVFSSNVTTVRAIQFGTGSITITGGFNQLVRGLNLTVTGTPTVNFSDPSATGKNLLYRDFTESNAFNCNVTTGTGNINLSISQFKTLNFMGFGGTLTLLTPSNPITLFGNLTFVSGMTFVQGTAPINFANTSGTATFTSAGKIPYQVAKSAGNGTLSLSGLTTVTDSFTFNRGTLQLPASTTTTVGTFITTGSTLKFLTSSISGTQATLSSANNVTATYLSVKDSNATGGGVFDATDVTNVNAGNVTGWSIVAFIASVSSNFFLVF